MDPNSTPTRFINRALVMAGKKAICDIQSDAAQVHDGGTCWWDTRPMLDPARWDPITVDDAQAAIDHALEAGLAYRHPTQPHLLHITRA